MFKARRFARLLGANRYANDPPLRRTMLRQPSVSLGTQGGFARRDTLLARLLEHYEGRARFRAQELKRYYHELVRVYFSSLVPEGARVLELGCGLGDLLAAVHAGQAVGVDFSPAMIELAQNRHPNLELHCAAAEDFTSDEPFDYILLADLVNEVYDVQELLEHLHALSHYRTRLLVSSFNHLWRPILTVAAWLGAKAPAPPQNWLSSHDMASLLDLAGWELIRTDARILWPIRTPLMGKLCNRWLAPLMRHLCLTTIHIARPKPARCSCHSPLGISSSGPADRYPTAEGATDLKEPHYFCSVIIPAKNEAGNIEQLVSRIPRLGSGTEIIFVEGGSVDNTRAEIERVTSLNPHRGIRLLAQTGQGKAQAVRQGFAASKGELLFILDADLSVPPEELGRFYDAARTGVGEFLNGVRSVYPMEQGAMRFANMIGNKLFSLTLGFILGQAVKDTLCGVKVLFRRDYEAIVRNRTFLEAIDPFGDFELLFGAAKLNLRIVDLPVHYQARSYGRTNISRWRHGWMLFKMAWVGARELKFNRLS